MLALGTRLLLLFLLYWMVNGAVFETPVFHLTDIGVPTSVIDRFTAAAPDEHFEIAEETLAKIHEENFEEANGISWKDLVLIIGGAFLLIKSVLGSP